jgi:ribosomal protein L11 methyltransferase
LSGWLQIEFHLPGCDSQRAEAFLDSLGALSITVLDARDEPLLEPLPGATPMWTQTIMRTLFPEDTNPSELKAQLSSEFDYQHYHSEILADQNWERAWMDNFEAMRFGEKLWVCPSWLEPPDPNGVNLMLDPGLAFGTGTHATTALCLEWLDANPPQGLSLIDYGCGSGILSLAALKLGAETVYGVDIDEQALLATRANAEKNAITPSQLQLSTAEQLNKPVDLLMANILCGPLVELAPHITKLVKCAGSIILSGILEDQIEEITTAYEPGFESLIIREKNGWVLIHGQKQSGS